MEAQPTGPSEQSVRKQRMDQRR